LGADRSATHLIPYSLLILLALSLPPVHAATEPSIPIIGRYSSLTIPIYIPASPAWAHDIVLNATIAWNQAQLSYQEATPVATVYSFVEADYGAASSVVSFSMPSAYASLAVGWTNYNFAPGSRTSIVSTRTYLTPTVFNPAQVGNETARRYAFWLALHELGRILGLGSVLDGKDIMEPRYTAARIDDVPNFSTLDLYALQVLAQGSAPNFVTLPAGVQDQLAPATAFLPNPHQEAFAPISGVEKTPPQVAQAPLTRLLRRFHFLAQFPL